MQRRPQASTRCVLGAHFFSGHRDFQIGTRDEMRPAQATVRRGGSGGRAAAAMRLWPVRPAASSEAWRLGRSGGQAAAGTRLRAVDGAAGGQQLARVGARDDDPGSEQ